MADVVWLNGPFGVGKTTTARRLVGSGTGLRYFDPEQVGQLLRHHEPEPRSHDFQDLPGWRRLVPVVADELLADGGDLLAVQTVLRQDYWGEIRSGLASLGHRVVHVVIHADEPELSARIDRDRVEIGARSWRLDHRADYLAALPWLSRAADLVVDSTACSSSEVANRVREGVEGTFKAQFGAIEREQDKRGNL